MTRIERHLADARLNAEKFGFEAAALTLTMVLVEEMLKENNYDPVRVLQVLAEETMEWTADQILEEIFKHGND